MAKKEKKNVMTAPVEKLNIPADEIWTYKIDGLQAPRIENRAISKKLKALIVVILLVAISLSIFFSIRAVSNDEYKYKEVESGIELIKYTNVDAVKEITIDKIDGKPITELHEYAFNCDEKVETINLSKNIQKIDSKSFYSCWNLKNVFVDPENPYYCDIDGVLYNKELTEVIYCPTAHDVAATESAGWKVEFPEDGSITNDDFSWAINLLHNCKANGTKLSDVEGDDAKLLEKLTTLTGEKDLLKFIDEYDAKVGIYVLPSTVTKVGQLAFAYSDITEIYLPEGVTELGSMAFFKAEKLRKVCSYKTDSEIKAVDYETASASFTEVYESLPEGLEFIGSDCFTYDRQVVYMYIPKSVTTIKHHAFFNMCYKEDGNIVGLAQMNVAADKAAFGNIEKGDHWLPQYDSGAFKKNIDVVYSASREKA